MALSPLNGSRDKTRSKFCCLVSIPVLADWFVIMTSAVCWFSVHGIFRRPAEPAEALPADGSDAVGCLAWSNSSCCLRSRLRLLNQPQLCSLMAYFANTFRVY